MLPAELDSADIKRIDAALADSSHRNNPYAICTAAIGEQHTEKWESCKAHVAGRLRDSGRMRDYFKDVIPGGDYLALQDEDGSWRITSNDGRGIAIMAEIPEGALENRKPIDRAWFEKVLERHKLREQEGYLAPVHINHHDEGRPTEKVGLLRLTSVGKVQYEGKEQDALFAEVVGVKSGDLAQIEELEFPYRSVEVRSWAAPELKGMALMSDQAPYFKFPLLKIGKRVPSAKAQELPAEAGPAVALADSAAGGSVLYRFADTKAVPLERKKPEEKKLAEDKPPFGKKDGDEDKDGDEKESPVEKAQEPEEEGKNTSAVMGILKQYLDLDDEGKATVIKLLAGVVPERKPTEGPAEQRGGYMSDPVKATAGAAKDPAAEAKAAENAAQAAAAKAKDSSAEAKLAELAGKVAALEAQEAARRERDKIDDLVEKTFREIKAKGWHFSDVSKARLREQVEVSREPEKSAKSFADGYMANTPKDPPRLADFEGAPAKKEHPAVLKFSDKGPQALARARALERQYAQQKEAGYPLRVSLEDYIDINFDEGPFLRSATAAAASENGKE